MKEMTYEEREMMTKLFENWLSGYVDEIIEKVMKRFDEIVNNEFAMNLLKELYEREKKEKSERIKSFEWMISDIAEKGKFTDTHCVHNHCLTHADSYRDVLYDMYIK